MQAELAQQGERPQDREPVAVHVVDEPEDLLALALQVPLVDAAVARVELHLEDLLLLRRQVGGHLFLGPALDQRLDPAPQPGQQLGVGRSRSGGRSARGTGWGSGTGPAP